MKGAPNVAGDRNLVSIHEGIGTACQRVLMGLGMLCLVTCGFDPGPVDGLFTAETRAAVRAYQARYGLPVSGLLDRRTRLELLPGLDQPGMVR